MDAQKTKDSHYEIQPISFDLFNIDIEEDKFLLSFANKVNDETIECNVQIQMEPEFVMPYIIELLSKVKLYEETYSKSIGFPEPPQDSDEV